MRGACSLENIPILACSRLNLRFGERVIRLCAAELNKLLRQFLRKSTLVSLLPNDFITENIFL